MVSNFFFKSHCRNLIFLVFLFLACNDLNDENLLRLLKKAPKLNGLGIVGNSQISGDSLVKSEKAFKELYISHCYGISDVDAYKVS